MIAFISHLKHKTEITNTDRTENRKYRAKLMLVTFNRYC